MWTMTSPSLSRLPPHHSSGYLCVIEACQGSRNKFKYEADIDAFTLHAVLPAGISFPYDFGFIPSTLGEDGDPLDVLVLMDEPAPVGCTVSCRLIGAIEADQRSGRKPPFRNDRLIAVASHACRYRHCRELVDISTEELDEIERFFVFYNEQRGVDFRPLGRTGAEHAAALVDEGIRRFAKHG